MLEAAARLWLKTLSGEITQQVKFRWPTTCSGSCSSSRAVHELYCWAHNKLCLTQTQPPGISDITLQSSSGHPQCLLNLCADRHFHDIHCQHAEKAGKVIRGSKRKTKERVGSHIAPDEPTSCWRKRHVPLQQQKEAGWMQDEAGCETAPFLCTALGSRAKLGGRRGVRCRIQVLTPCPQGKPLEICSDLRTRGWSPVHTRNSYLQEWATSQICTHCAFWGV